MTTVGRSVRLGAGGEFDLIRSFLGAGAPLPDDVLLGPGDDAALLAGGGHAWAVTCDLAVEDVHFRRAWLAPEEIGWRAASAALSDLAAMAADPRAALLSLAVGADDARSGFAGAVMEGAREACAAVGAAVVGGDLTRSPGPLTLDVVALGRAARPLTRDGAVVGDSIWVTGRLGASAAAVALWERGLTPSAELRGAYARPRPRVEEAIWLAGSGLVHGALDLSDGLAGDAGHLAAASGVGVVLDAEAVPVAPGVGAAADDPASALGLALSGGEDYELCIAAAAGLEELRGAFEARFGVSLTRVGRVVEGEGVHLRRGAGTPEPLVEAGYDHFGFGGSAP